MAGFTKNAEALSADKVSRIPVGMAESGWTQPVLVAGDGKVIAGHGRVLAATRSA